MRLATLALAAFMAMTAPMGMIMTTASAGSEPAEKSQAAVEKTMRDMYEALAADDAERLTTIFAEDFYAFDAGKRFDGPALTRLVIDAHKAGKRFVWTVNEADVRIQGNWAWIAYVNRGSVEDKSVVTPVTWLESAMLKFDAGRWRISFFHSSRVPPAP
jgi:ketosteroid isomerase-like protein